MEVDQDDCFVLEEFDSAKLKLTIAMIPTNIRIEFLFVLVSYISTTEINVLILITHRYIVYCWLFRIH